MKVYKTKFKYNGNQLKMNEIIPLSTYYITSGLEIYNTISNKNQLIELSKRNIAQKKINETNCDCNLSKNIIIRSGIYIKSVPVEINNNDANRTNSANIKQIKSMIHDKEQQLTFYGYQNNHETNVNAVDVCKRCCC